MAIGSTVPDTVPWLPRRSSDPDVDFAMTLLLPLLLFLGALAAGSAAPMTASAAPAPAPAPAWRTPAYIPGPSPQRRSNGGGGGGSAATLLGAALGGGLGAGIGGRTLGELAESELDRYAFLMLDPAASGSDSMPVGAVTRRITPKSVFIAPSINGDRDQCAEGYQQDEMGRCVKVIKVDAEKSWDLLLDKLNNQFADLPFPASELETTPPPGPPPGPFQLAIPIAAAPEAAPEATAAAATPEPAQPAQPAAPQPPSSAAVESAASEQVTETVTEEEEEEPSTTPALVDEETETPAPTTVSEDDVHDALIPEVVMLTSEEQPHAAPAPAAQGSTYLVNSPIAVTTGTGNPSRRPVAGTNQPDVGDVNPIINTVNNSPLVTGDSLVQEVPTSNSPSQLAAEASTQLQQLLAVAFGTPLQASPSTTAGPVAAAYLSSSSTPTPPSTESSTAPSMAASSTFNPVSTSSTTASPSSSNIEDEVVPTTDAALPSRVEESTPSSTTTSTSTTPSSSSTTSEPTPSSTSSTALWASSDESRPASSNFLRPSQSLLPVIAPDLHAVRFPAERPGGTPLRFPSIDVTFPTSRGGAAGSSSGGDANRLPVDKPVVFPKDVYWPPLPPAPYWGLEQTRNRPQQQQQHRTQHNRFWQARPSHSLGSLGFGGANTLSTAGGASSPYSSSGSSSSSSSQEGSQARRRMHYRGGSGGSSTHTHRSSSHRRGREW